MLPDAMPDATTLDCPNCRRQGFVRCQDPEAGEPDAFECIYCHHRGNLSDSPDRDHPIDAVFAALVAALLVLLIVGM
jgi:hypothetical protein